MEKRVYFSVRNPWWGSQKNAGGGEIFQGLLGVEPCFCAWPRHPLLTAPEDVATLSLKVLELRKCSTSSG